MMVRTPVDTGWTLHLETARHTPDQAPPLVPSGPVPARVPGCVHTDLLAAGLIPDPYLDRDETEVAWVGRADWRYTTSLPAAGSGHERADLVFEGLDTVAELTLGGTPLGTTRNMHRTHRFDATGPLGAGPAELSVRLTCAYQEAERLRAALGDRPNAYPEPFNFVRKMACSFGWDWGPTLVTAGIWRPVHLERWSTARLDRVRPHVTVDGGAGRVRVDLDVERTAGGARRPLLAAVTVAGRRATARLAPGVPTATVELDVPRPRLWWPHGYGEQHRYTCEVTLADAATGETLDVWSRGVGFRDVRLETAPDEHGSAFTFVVNGVPVFARGVNWIPDDAFPSRVTPDRYRHRLGQAASAGVDLVRVWGGGVYEDRAFYEACDELGLMVWQDFAFACAAYPEEEPLRSEVEAEARDNVARLMPHPSLVLWNGNNENLWGFHDWGWAERLAGTSWGEGYYRDLLPRVVAELDPGRPYWAGSPWSGSWEHEPNDPCHGTTHSWEVWNRRDYTGYLDDVPRFVAEFGWQAPAAYATIRRCVSDPVLTPDSPAMLHHQKAEDGQGKLERGLAHHFEVPRDFDTWHYLTQINQARAIATGVEHWRSHWPRCAGTVVWQLNDCWPVTSWAAIDGDARPKPLYFELRRLYADRLLSFQRRAGALVLTAANQGAAAWSAPLVVRRVHADGRVLAEHRVRATVPPRSVAPVGLPDGLVRAGDAAAEFWVADCGELRAVWFARPDKEFAFRPARCGVEVAPADRGGAVVTVTAHTLLRDLLLQADRVHPDAVADRGRLTLLPGESARIRLTGCPAADPRSVAAALYCVNGRPAAAGSA